VANLEGSITKTMLFDINEDGKIIGDELCETEIEVYCTENTGHYTPEMDEMVKKVRANPANRAKMEIN
jgi:hypothetical protein